MAKTMEQTLKSALDRLQKAEVHIHKNKPYEKEREKLRILAEMIKEQIKNENSDSATR
ncbi:MAG: hypothetical protein ACLGGX_07325 [Bdellovibrionia bacterium]